jgi:Tfp pilus assembly protein PilV
MQLRRQPSFSGFSLVETVIASAIAASFLTSLFTMNMMTMGTIRSAKESIAASQILQQRMESMRIANWHQVTDAAWIRDNLLNTAAPSSTQLKSLVETLILVPYGSANTGNTQVCRSGGTASIVNQNTTLLTEKAIKVIWTLTYRGAPSERALSRQVVAILADGGVAK